MSEAEEIDVLPDFFTPCEIARTLQAALPKHKKRFWNTRNTRHRLRKAGCLHKVGGRWMASKDKLRQFWPELLDVLHRKGLERA